MYWWKLYKDIKLWRKFAKISKASREKLKESDLRVDNLGRIYTVINLPDEVADGNEYMHEAWVLQNLGPYNKILGEIGLAGYVYPEISRIKEPGTSAYLLVLYPDAQTINIRRFIWNVIFWTVGFFTLRAIWRLLDQYVDFHNVLEKVSNYLF